MAGELRVAIAGAGFMGRVHARSARLAGARIVGVAASTPARSEAAAAALGAERAYGDPLELVTADDVDVVHICTPNHLHQPLAEAALGAGKPVICEKPLALDAAGAQRLVEAAGRAAVHAAVPFVYRYHPVVREARARVTSGASGTVRLIHGSYLQDWLLRPEDDNWRVRRSLGGASRAFADIGSHWCDLVEFATGHRIARVSAQLMTALPQRASAEGRQAFAGGDADTDAAMRSVSTEDAAVVQFETDGGAIGSTVISQVSPGRKNRLWLEIDCAEEALAFDQENPELLWSGRRERLELVRRDPETLSADAARLATLPAGHPQGYDSCFAAFVADVYAAVRGESPADGLPVFADGLRAALITDAVLRSAAERQWVEVPAAGGTAAETPA